MLQPEKDYAGYFINLIQNFPIKVIFLTTLICLFIDLGQDDREVLSISIRPIQTVLAQSPTKPVDTTVKSVKTMTTAPNVKAPVLNKSQSFDNTPKTQGGSLLNIKVRKDSVGVGEDVNFTIKLDSTLVRPSLRLVIEYGDGQTKTLENSILVEVTHSYPNSGKFKVYVKVQKSSAFAFVDVGKTLVDSVTVNVQKWSLVIEPQNAVVGDSVIYKVRPKPVDRRMRFWFNFGDGNSTNGWINRSTISESYSSAGTYVASVRIGRRDTDSVRPVGSAQDTIVVKNPTPTSPTILTLKADRETVQVGEEVRFWLEPEKTTVSSPYNFIFDFGDGSSGMFGKIDGSQINHYYAEAGTYVASVSIESPAGINVNVSRPTVGNTVNIRVNDWNLVAVPQNSTVGETVTLEVSPAPTDANLRFKFAFGDDTFSDEWTVDQTISHAYHAAGTFDASVEIVRVDGGNSRLIKSIHKAVEVTASGIVNGTEPIKEPKFKWWYVAAGILVLLAVTKTWLWRVSLRPKFYPHSDLGTPRMKKGDSLSFGFQLRLNTGIAAGRYQIKARGAELINKIRRGNV